MKRTEFTQPWLDALRSGEYKQARGVLHDYEGFHRSYCCLAVGLNVIKSEEWDALEGKLGISYDERSRLIHLNDREKKTFPEIADEIEKMLEPEA